MSDNTPNWADKANVALNAVQVVQLHQVQSALQALTALEADRAQRELDEQQAREREARFREFIWKLEDAFDGYTRRPGTTPCGKYILAKQTLACLEKVQVSTACFTQFSDKDRFGAFGRHLQQELDASLRVLSPTQVADAESYLRFEAEAENLDALIHKAQDRKIELAAVKRRKTTAARELEELRSEAKSEEERQAPTPFWAKALAVALVVGVVIIIAAVLLVELAGIFSIGVFVYCWIEGTPGNNGRFLGYGLALMAIPIVPAVLLGFIVSRLPPGARSLRERIEAAQSMIGLANAKIDALKDKRPVVIDFKRFGARNLAGLLKERETRAAFLVQCRQTYNL